MRQSETEPRTPDETLAAHIDEIADEMHATAWMEEDNSEILFDAAKRLRELAAVSLIADERRRQREHEGWTATHDDTHDAGEMARAAAVYALPLTHRELVRHHELSENGGRDLVWQQPRFWPWEPDWYKPTPDNRIRELVKAGALIVAEIERLQRADARQQLAQGGTDANA